MTGILLGVETGIDRDLYDQFNLTGVSHIIVISGSNISLIAGVMTALFGRLFGKRRAFFVVVAGILIYTLLVGADGSVTRAAIMGILYAWATYLGRQSTAIVSLFAAAWLMTLINPLTLWDVGFQLSFMATLSLILFTPGMTGWFEGVLDNGLSAVDEWIARVQGRRVTRAQGHKGAKLQATEGTQNEEASSVLTDLDQDTWLNAGAESSATPATPPLRTFDPPGPCATSAPLAPLATLRPALLAFLNDALIVTLAAQVLTLPLVAYTFGRVSVVSPLANLLVLPVQPPIMIWGGGAVLVGLLAGWLEC